MKKPLCLNEICYSLDKERDQLLHLMRLYSIKSTFKIKPPEQYKFLKNNKSKLLKRAQTQLQIDYENNILARKILKIQLNKGEYNQNNLRPKTNYPAFRRNYFNYKFQEIEKMKTIFEGNMHLKYRLDNVKSHYKTENIFEEARKQEEYLNNIISKNRTIKVPPPLNYYDINDYKNLIEEQNKNENIDQNVIEEDEREGDEDGEKNKENEEENKNKNENQKNEENNINPNNQNESNKKVNEEKKKNNASTTNNSTKDKNNA